MITVVFKTWTDHLFFKYKGRVNDFIDIISNRNSHVCQKKEHLDFIVSRFYCFEWFLWFLLLFSVILLWAHGFDGSGIVQLISTFMYSTFSKCLRSVMLICVYCNLLRIFLLEFQRYKRMCNSWNCYNYFGVYTVYSLRF